MSVVDFELLYELSKGNPGALSVISRLDADELKKLKKTELRGPMIWVGYKDICKEDIDAFKSKLKDGTIEALVKQTPDWKHENA